jgi:nicotinamidase-related amidase
MAESDVLLKPEECVMLLVDFQAGLAFGVESIPRQVVVNNAVALARTCVAFKVPVVASTSASRVYSGPLLPALQEALPCVKAFERKNMNVWEDDAASGFVGFVARPVALELQEQLDPAREAGTGLFHSSESEFMTGRRQATTRICDNENFKSVFQSREHGKGDTRLREEASNDQPSSLCGKNWPAIVVANGGGYGMGLAYAREMIHPT